MEKVLWSLIMLLYYFDFLEIDMTGLRQQQIRLGLLKAACVLFSQQENLLQIMTSKSDVIDDDEYQYSLFQQLLSAATRPSPVKAMFGKEELESAAVSICQYLAAEVHSPQTNEATEKKQPRKASVARKPPPSQSNTPTTTAGTVALPVPDPPPPSRIVSQIMEMGFQRRRIEYAIQVSHLFY